MLTRLSRNAVRRRIHSRNRPRLQGRGERPRLNVYRSTTHIYAQIIDDSRGHTLLAASSLDPEVRKTLKGGGNIAAAKTVGKTVAERAKAAGITEVVFDRGGYAYHGRIKALAESARQAGLKF